MGFPTPKVFVTADSVAKGKPDPEGKRALPYPLLLLLFCYRRLLSISPIYVLIL